ncbi:MAG: hypothetical protein ACRDHD_02385 [Candidatus Limnocylindria bacterium]
MTDAARRLIREAWRAGRILALHHPWAGYPSSLAGVVGRWHDAGDPRGLADHVAVSEMSGAVPVYVPAELLPLLRAQPVQLAAHSILGLWRGIAVRPLEPVRVPARGRRRGR